MNTETRQSALWAGWLLIAGSVVGWIGAFSPVLMMPRKDIASNEVWLYFVAAHQLSVVVRDGGFLGGVVLTVLGFAALTTTFRSVRERQLSELALISFLLGAVFWVMHLAFRLTATLGAARELLATGVVPTYFAAAPLAGFFGFLFGVYWVLAYVAIAAYGGAILRTQVLPASLGWSAIVFAVLFALTGVGGDALPLFIHVIPFAIGVVLLRRAKRVSDGA
ncbi:MAG: hypothetical protein ACRD1B_01245 [Thermoanaerobaculia bacterium]